MGRYNRFSFTFEMIAFAIDLASYLPLMQARYSYSYITDTIPLAVTICI